MGMNARSTNTKGFVHYGGDVVSGVEDGIGVIIPSASTGGSPFIEPISDSSTAALGVRAKGAAKLTLGNSSNSVDVLGSAVKLGSASVDGIKGVYSTNSTWSLGAISTNAVTELTLTTGTVTCITGDLVSLQMVGMHNAAVMGFRLSTVGTSNLTVTVANYSSVASTASSGTIYVQWVDLT